MTHYPSAQPTGFRLRFENQEVALANGTTVIGRDPSCLITFLDSLISRRHARIQCDNGEATIEDLASRNGTRVNGILISGPHSLRDGDRIDIGSHTLVVGVADPGAWALTDSATGLMQVCLSCRSPCPGDTCPLCGWARTTAKVPTPRAEETAQARWSLGMLLEMLGKAILTERVVDTERVMREVVFVVEDQLRNGRGLEPDELHALGEATHWLSHAQQDQSWSEWMDSVRDKVGVTIPPPA